jgi:hypothetical protein
MVSEKERKERTLNSMGVPPVYKLCFPECALECTYKLSLKAIADHELFVAASMATAAATLEQKIANISSDEDTRRRLAARNLQAYSITWEDTGRWKESAYGPNISDMTLAVGELAMPVIRRPNFSDQTVDVPMQNVYVSVGNERRGGGSDGLERITLRSYLENAGRYLQNDKVDSLYAPERDSAVLASSQACVLPLRDGKIAFHVTLFNYQSESDDPAVLVIVATSQGTSAQVVDSSTRSLYFNDAGNSVELLAKRLEDDRRERGVALTGPKTAAERNRNMIYLIQVPLKQRERPRRRYYASKSAPMYVSSQSSGMGGGVPESAAMRGFDDAVIEKGTESKGEFRGTRGLRLERDHRFPIRLTVQFYSVTDNARVPDTVIEEFDERIKQIYSKGIEPTSSLVVDGDTGRITEKKPTTTIARCGCGEPAEYECRTCHKHYCSRCHGSTPTVDPLMYQ